MFVFAQKISKKLKLLILVLLHFTGAIIVVGYVHYSLRDVISKIKQGDFYHIENITFVRDKNNLILSKIGQQYREYVILEKVPPLLIETILSVEDEHFFQHKGISIQKTFFNIFKALFTNYKVVGASTITQQTARNVFLTNKVSVTRKIKEMWIALMLSKYVSKKKILEIYINHIFLGSDTYGVNSCAKRLFNKNMDQLSVNEIAFIVAIIKGPSYYLKNKEQALIRKDYVLKRMQQTGLISTNTYQKYINVPVEICNNTIKGTIYGHLVEDIRLILEEKDIDALHGYDISVTIDPELQLVAFNSLNQHIKAHEAKLKQTFSELKDQNMIINGAVIVIEPKTGKILSLVGGRGLEYSYVNGAKIVKSPGSIAKLLPLITAFEKGYSGDFQLYNAPIYIDDHGKIQYILPEEMDEYRKKSGKVVKNHNNVYNGYVSIEDTIIRSINTTSVVLTSLLGVDQVKATAVKMGIIENSQPYYLASSLGSIYTTMENFIRAMASLANGGYKLHRLYYIDEIKDFDGNIVFKEDTNTIKGEKIFSDEAVGKFNYVCGKVKQFGIRNKLNMIQMPLMCKTGTGQNQREAAFLVWNENYMVYVIIYSVTNETVDNLWGGTAPLFIARDILIFLQNEEEKTKIKEKEKKTNNPETDTPQS